MAAARWVSRVSLGEVATSSAAEGLTVRPGHGGGGVSGTKDRQGFHATYFSLGYRHFEGGVASKAG